MRHLWDTDLLFYCHSSKVSLIPFPALKCGTSVSYPHNHGLTFFFCFWNLPLSLGFFLKIFSPRQAWANYIVHTGGMQWRNSLLKQEAPRAATFEALTADGSWFLSHLCSLNTLFGEDVASPREQGREDRHECRSSKWNELCWAVGQCLWRMSATIHPTVVYRRSSDAGSRGTGAYSSWHEARGGSPWDRSPHGSDEE